MEEENVERERERQRQGEREKNRERVFLILTCKLNHFKTIINKVYNSKMD